MHYQQRLLLTLAFCILMLPGCQTLKSKFSSMPKLPSPKDLAFWKKDSDFVPPPPPSRHLNPAASDSMDRLSITETDDSQFDLDQYSAGLDQKIGEVRNDVDRLASKIKKRSPYTMGDESDSKMLGSPRSGSSFNPTGRFASTNGDPKATSSLSDERKRFGTAIAAVENSAGQNDVSSGFKSSRDMFASATGESVEQKIESNKSGFNSGFKALTQGSGLKDSLSKVNNSLYDINNNIASATKDVGKVAEDTFGAAKNKLSQTFGAMTEGARGVAKSSEEFAGKIKDRIASAATTSPFGGDKSGGFVGIGKDEPKVAGVNSRSDFPRDLPVARAQESFSFNRTRTAEVTPAESTRFGSSADSEPATPSSRQDSLQLPQFASSPNQKAAEHGTRVATANNNAQFDRAPSFSRFSSGEKKQATSHVSDVDLPAKLLSGSGSYAPGSVILVR